MRRIVHLSTCAVYGPRPHRGAYVGELAPAPVSPASSSRLAGEASVLDAGGLVLRAGLVLGRGDGWVVPALAGTGRTRHGGSPAPHLGRARRPGSAGRRPGAGSGARSRRGDDNLPKPRRDGGGRPVAGKAAGSVPGTGGPGHPVHPMEEWKCPTFRTSSRRTTCVVSCRTSG
ncbi:hypothetical protein ACFP74_07335, partial [Streptomyces virginiae]